MSCNRHRNYPLLIVFTAATVCVLQLLSIHARLGLDQSSLQTAWDHAVLVGGAKQLPLPPPPRPYIVIVADPKSQQRYSSNIQSLKCYGKVHNVNVIVTAISDACKESVDGFFFQKHCQVAELMTEQAAADTFNKTANGPWFLVLDADNAVVNFNHRIEDYGHPTKDVIHGLRFHNNEVMAGYYMVRNTAYGREYVRDWSLLGPKHKDIHGYSGMNEDNGALHWHLLHKLGNERLNGWTECRNVGKAGRNYGQFVTCFHAVLKTGGCQVAPDNEWDKIAIWPHGKFVSYDGWVTYYKYTDRTFMHHAMKNPLIQVGSHKGRIMPTLNESVCNKDLLDWRDEWYVSETHFQELMDETQVVQRKAHNPTSWDANSCIQNGYSTKV